MTGAGAARVYSYNALGQLKSASHEGAPVVSHRLDYFGRRVETKVDGTVTGRAVYLDDLRIAGDFDASGGLVQAYAYGSGTTAPDYSVKGGAKYFFVKDHLGSPRLVVNSETGLVMYSAAFDEFGRAQVSSGTQFQDYGYAGGIYDHRTKPTKFGARSYDAETGKWTSKDPSRFEGSDIDLYGYVFLDLIKIIYKTGFRYELPNENMAGPPRGGQVGAVEAAGAEEWVLS